MNINLIYVLCVHKRSYKDKNKVLFSTSASRDNTNVTLRNVFLRNNYRKLKIFVFNKFWSFLFDKFSNEKKKLS